MKITFILPEHNLSGGNRIVANHARELHARGHEVIIIAPPKPPAPLKNRIKSMLGMKGWHVDTPMDTSFYEDAAYQIKTLEQHRPVTAADVPDGDLVIATWWKTVEWVNEYPPEKGAKVHFIQGYDATDFSPADKVDATWRLPFYKIAVSHWLAELGRKQLNVDVHQVIHNSVDLVRFHSPQRSRQPTPVVGFLFSDYPGKGTHTAVEVLTRLRRQFPALRGLCFGNPSPGFKNNLPDWIEFHRKPGQDKIREIYSRCDAWLYTSRQDGFGLTPLEAMACRTPVITTRVGAMPELISDGYNGYLANPEDVETLERKTGEVLSCPVDKWKSLSDNAFVTASSYTWPEAGELMETALLNALPQQSPQHSIRAA